MKNSKKIFIYLFLIVPKVCWASSDACTNPKEYTIDRRCYVNNDAWQKAPYKHVLKMSLYNNVFCTANMVSGKIVTAKHCITNKDLPNVEFIAFDGTKISANLYKYGGDLKDILSDDWAVLIPNPGNKHFVETHSINNIENISSTESGSFVSIGCGSLKPLSDTEITLFKRAYIDFLKDYPVYTKTLIDDGETVNLTSMLSKNEFYNIYKYMEKYNLPNIFVDDTENIKVSICKGMDFEDDPMLTKFFSKADLVYGKNCQAWHGNSGGGIFRISNNNVNLTNLVTSELCKGASCGIFAILRLGDSLISSNPERHTGSRSGIVPAVKIEPFLSDE